MINLAQLIRIIKILVAAHCTGDNLPSSNIANLSMINLTQSRIIKMIKKDVCGKGGPAANSNKTENLLKIH